MRTVKTLLAATLVAAPGLVRAEQPMATFSAFNDWISSDFRGVRIDADGVGLF